MPEYGSRLYWNKRYSKSEEAFDWMCDYDQLEPTLLPLLAHNNTFDYSSKKDCKILIVGCGNANFSVDFVKRSGFKSKNVIHIDYCDVVIQQQKNKYPELNFRVMDALNMTFGDEEFDFIIDKSLIDTTLCYPDGHQTTELLFNEMHRVLKRKGRIVTISLHTEDEVKQFSSSDTYDYEFICSSCKILNKRRQKDENDIRCLYHTIAIFDKVKDLDDEEKGNVIKWHKNTLSFENALNDEEYYSMVHDILLAQEDGENSYYRYDLLPSFHEDVVGIESLTKKFSVEGDETTS